METALKQKKRMLRRIPYKQLGALLWLLAVLGFSLAFGLRRIALCDYVSIDGDWQSYNVFRRILAGQRPFTDFANYIGMAPVFVNLPLVWLAGGSFSDSLLATNFTASVLFAAAVFCLLYLAGAQFWPALAISALWARATAAHLFYVLPGGDAGYWLTDTFTGLYTPSNSMRVARSFLPFLLALALLAWNALLPRRAVSLLHLFETPRRCAGCGLVLGLCIVWSNDYSLACIAAAGVILVFQHLCCYRAGAARFAACLAAWLAGIPAGAAVSAALVTGGHPGAWLASFAGTGSAQYVYFSGTNRVPVVRYLFTCGRFWLGAAFCVAVLLVCTAMLFRRKLSDEGLLLYFVMASILAATIAYILAGSGYYAREPLEGYSIVLAVGLLIRALYSLAGLPEKKQAAPAQPGKAARPVAVRVLSGLFAVLLAAGCAFSFTDVLRARQDRATGYAGVHIDVLGGYSTFTQALIDADAWTQGQPVFSMYATGLEAVKGTFQPTGYDYIIHALGASAQADYEAAFLAGSYPYVQTPSMNVDGWLALQNWYCYRHIWRYYTKMQSTEYSWIWQRTGDNAIDADLSLAVTDNGDGSVTISCSSSVLTPMVVDLEVDYALTDGDAWQRLLNLGRGSVYAVTGSIYADAAFYAGESREQMEAGAALPESGTAHLPLILENGSGSIRLESLYTGGGNVTVTRAQALAALPRWNLADAAAAQ